MKYVLNKNVGEYKKGKEVDVGNTLVGILYTWIALGFLDEVGGKWKPKMNEIYHFVENDGSIVTDDYTCFSIEKNRLDFGNCFPNEAKATEARDKIKELLNGLKQYE